MKILFMGTPKVSSGFLSRLVANKSNVIMAVTQPDKAKGRSSTPIAPPVKILAEENNIPVFQPEDVNSPESISFLEGLNPDLGIVISYGQILTENLLNIFNIDCINVHFSVLPKYRGASPINYAIINGDEATGVSIIQIVPKLDAGPIYAVRTTGIDLYDTPFILGEKLSKIGADLLIDIIPQIKNGTITPLIQNEENATVAPKIQKSDGKIDWAKHSITIHNLIRGYHPWPGSFSFFKSKKSNKDLKVKIIKARPVTYCEEFEKLTPGAIFIRGKSELIVTALTGGLSILEIQPENKRKMSSGDFINGYRVSQGDFFYG